MDKKKRTLRESFMSLILESADEIITVFISGFTGGMLGISFSQNLDNYWPTVFWICIMVTFGVVAKAILRYSRVWYGLEE